MSQRTKGDDPVERETDRIAIKGMPSVELDYDLPRHMIAQEPASRREDSRLLVLDRATGAIAHRRFSDLPAFLRPGDTIVINESRVVPARLRLVKEGTGGAVEVLLLAPAGPGAWEALLTPGGRVRPGLRLCPPGGEPVAEIVTRAGRGRWILRELVAIPGGCPGPSARCRCRPTSTATATEG